MHLPIGAQGYDWSFAGTAVDPRKVKASGASFAVRYLSHDPTKDISPGEQASIAAAGLVLLLVVELASTTSLGGAAVGDALGAEMVQRAKALGYDGPLIFAHDTGTRDPLAISAASDFFRAVWSHTVPAGYGRAVYGPGFFLADMDRLVPAYGPLDLAWQAAPGAWDAGWTYPGAHIVQQYDAGPGAQGAFGGSVDRNVVQRDITYHGGSVSTRLVRIANDWAIYATDGVHATHVTGDAYADFLALYGQPVDVSPAFLGCLALTNPASVAPKAGNVLTDASNFLAPPAPAAVSAAPSVDLSPITSRLDALDAAVKAPKSITLGVVA